MRFQLRRMLCLLAPILFLAAGCSTSFKYNPSSQPVHDSVSQFGGLAILTGEDLRPAEERRPGWAKHAESIVAHALAQEVKNTGKFSRVKIHVTTASPKKYSTLVRFRVMKFECYNQPAFMEQTGRDILRFQGLQGFLIAESIPSKYFSEVEIEFDILEAVSQRVLFTKKYSASRNLTVNGYQGEKPKVAETSAALEEVLTQFAADLEKISAR